ncbi:MAG: HipA domain-containing protein [Sphaerochaeta sp.]|nr:HipA domain-containing protein [Sphaerochaeta sp.]
MGDSSLENDRDTYQYSYTDIMQMLTENTKLTQVSLTISQFWRMYIIDALVGNFDRHGANWGFIKENNHYTLAPIFDNGSCLFPRIHSDEACLSILDDQKEIEKRIYSFPTSQIKLCNKKSSYHDIIFSLQFPECNKALQDITRKTDCKQIDAFIDLIDEISGIQKRFYKTIIRERYEKILLSSYEKLLRETV